MQCQVKFLSTLSLRRATGCGQYCIRAPGISIHALLAESDNQFSASRIGKKVISIHALLAESDGGTHQARRATQISIHALLAESDNWQTCATAQQTNFYPRSPCGERQGQHGQHSCCRNFYPRSPCGERLLPINVMSVSAVFLSTLSLRRATSGHR